MVTSWVVGDERVMNSRRPPRVDDSAKDHRVDFDLRSVRVDPREADAWSRPPMAMASQVKGQPPPTVVPTSMGPASAAVHPSTTIDQTVSVVPGGKKGKSPIWFCAVAA